MSHRPILPSGSTVLVLDNAPGILAAFRRAFVLEGAATLPAGCLADALAQFDEHLPDLVVGSVEIKDDEGISLIRAVRSRPLDRGGAVPAIAMTDDESRVEDAVAAGYDEALVTPFGLDDLYDVVKGLDIQIAEARTVYWKALETAREQRTLRARLKQTRIRLLAQRERRGPPKDER